MRQFFEAAFIVAVVVAVVILSPVGALLLGFYLMVKGLLRCGK